MAAGYLRTGEHGVRRSAPRRGRSVGLAGDTENSCFRPFPAGGSVNPILT